MSYMQPVLAAAASSLQHLESKYRTYQTKHYSSANGLIMELSRLHSSNWSLDHRTCLFQDTAISQPPQTIDDGQVVYSERLDEAI